MLQAKKFVWKKIRVLLLLCLLVPAPTLCWAENLKVLVILSDNSAPYQSFANSLNNSLPAMMRSAVQAQPEKLPADLSEIELIVAVGMRATELAASQSSIPVLAVMIPQVGYEELLAQTSLKKITRSISAIYLDQPWVRRLDFWRAALPSRHRIGLLYSPGTHIDIEGLRGNIAARGGSLIAQPVLLADELFAELESVLASSDVLFAVPDNMIYSSNNIRNILLTSYRHGIPLIGLSQAYVNAGALCAIFSTPEQLAEQTGATVISFSRTGLLPEPQYPVAFTIAVNQQVARSLGIELLSLEAIRNQMNKAKGAVP